MRWASVPSSGSWKCVIATYEPGVSASMYSRTIAAGSTAFFDVVQDAAQDQRQRTLEFDFFAIADAAEDVVRPAMPQECLLDRQALMMGYADVYSSFLEHAERQAERYGVSAAEMLVRAGKRKLVGGQEDQLIDIALELQREKATVSA